MTTRHQTSYKMQRIILTKQSTEPIQRQMISWRSPTTFTIKLFTILPNLCLMICSQRATNLPQSENVLMIQPQIGIGLRALTIPRLPQGVRPPLQVPLDRRHLLEFQSPQLQTSAQTQLVEAIQDIPVSRVVLEIAALHMAIADRRMPTVYRQTAASPLSVAVVPRALPHLRLPQPHPHSSFPQMQPAVALPKTPVLARHSVTAALKPDTVAAPQLIALRNAKHFTAPAIPRLLRPVAFP